jgi:hypothetical protein
MPDQEPALGPPQRWFGRSSYILSLLTILALVGFNFLAFHGEPDHLASAALGTIQLPTPQSHSPAPETRLVVVSQKAFTNEPLPTGISLMDASGEETVTLLGLADGFELSLGTSRGPGAWLLSARELDQAFVGPTKDFVGNLDITVQLRSGAGQLLDSKTIQFEWVAKDDNQEQKLQAESREPAPLVQPRDPVDLALLIERGEALLRNGDIVSARLLLKRAAIEGSAQAALRLGMTFDPAFLSRLSVFGVDPDEAQARDWYERASELGSIEASVQLKRLAGDNASDGLH